MCLLLTAPSLTINLEKVLLVLGFWGALLLILGQLFRYLRTRAEVLKALAESRNRLLAMVTSLDQLVDLARTEEGRRLLEPPALPSHAPHGLRMVQGGIALVVFSLGLWVTSGFRSPATTLSPALAGLGLIVGGYAGRYLRARWLRSDAR